MRKHILMAIALLAIPTGLHAQELQIQLGAPSEQEAPSQQAAPSEQEAPNQVDGLCGLSLAAQTVYEGACVFEKQADAAGAKTIEVQMDNGLNVTFLRPANSNQWTVTTLEGTTPVAIEPQPGEVIYQWEGVTLTAKSPSGPAAAEPAAETEAEPSASNGGGVSLPETGDSQPSTGERILDRVVDRAADRAVRRGTDAALRGLFGF